MNQEQGNMQEAFVKHARTAELLARAESGEDVSESVPEVYQNTFNDLLAKRKAQQEQQDQANIAVLKRELANESDPASEAVDTKSSIKKITESVLAGRKQAVVDLYEGWLKDLDNPESRRRLASGLFQDRYNQLRTADYPVDPKEDETWEKYLHSTNIPVNNKKAEWMYRGVFTKQGEQTSTRGSLNVRVEPALIDALDKLIISGKIKANYKFGQPGTSASPNDRHDSISIYFLEEPSNEALEELAAIAKPYVRGDNLLGKKIADGFFMSEVGSVESKHIDSFVEALKSKDEALAEAVRQYSAPQPGRGTALKLSEAQYYAVKDVAKAFGYNIEYNKDKGFEISDA
ncbi:MAG TPA: hypothetical protein VEC13_01445 [Candidatus Paceibacterota bacterium]|nr:hypothetical protein [Candidatus Paceibacterota bacterium]